MTYAPTYNLDFGTRPSDPFAALTRNVANYWGATIEAAKHAVDSYVSMFASSSPSFAFQIERGFVASSNISSAVNHTSKEVLLRFAEKRLNATRNAGEVELTLEAEWSLWALLNALVEQDGPTPQLVPTGDGAVEVQWLSGGVFVSAIFDESGDFDVYALENDSEVLLSEEVEFGQALTSETTETLVSLLARMGKTAKLRPALLR
ncbi:MAG TPA: hypothetical protein VHZ81_09890 [Galbitalea sp.]|nr:hypothetical protein [Galbitalea sp.]